eukprot:10618920-Alexandrium_andersonii.AAC.1
MVSSPFGSPGISPTQPFSPARGLLTPGREHALGEGRAASLPPLHALRASFEAAAPPPSPPADTGLDHVRGGGRSGQGGSKAAARQKEDKDLASAMIGFLEKC